MRRLGSILLLALFALAGKAQVSDMERQFMALQDRFELRDKTVAKDLKNYVVMYPYTTYMDEVHFMQGVLLEERGLHKKALKELEIVEFKSLSRDHQPQYQFYRGYANLMLQQYDRAATYFNILRKGNSVYQSKGAYYYAYCMYKTGDVEKALPALESLENNTAYQETVPYYIVQIYYARHDDEQVIARANKLLQSQPDNANNKELHRMLGEIYFQKEAYRQSVSHLKTAETDVRNDLYLLGAGLYQLKDYEQSIQYLKQVELQNDSLSESVYLCLGHAYMQMGNIEQAKLAYHAAAHSGISAVVREEAMYNYALTTYQSSSALGESVNAFMDFLKEYPHSKYENRILALLSDALRKSKNYEAALAALDSISHPDAKLLETKQYLRYQLATDAYLQGKMEQSNKWFTELLMHPVAGSSGADYMSEAYYWRAETDYQLGRYEDCAKDLSKYYTAPASQRSPNRNHATYLSGYNHFALKQYETAKSEFEAYLQTILSTDPTYSDALCRIGDCEFNARRFGSAITYYGRAIDAQGAQSDYALFQRGYAEGLLHRYADKISTMTTLVTLYPKSDYADDALYEKARTLIQQEDERSAITTYENLLQRYPKSPYARRSCLERAMLYRNLNDVPAAITAYKQTIERYPATEEAYTALRALEDIYVEQNRVNEYVAFTKNLDKYHMSSSFREDSLQYTAHYMAASQAYEAKNYDRALLEYKELTGITGNPYLLEAYTRCAELTYDKADYATALSYFTQMEFLASTRDQVNTARLGILRCNESLHRTQPTIDIATRILTDEPVSDKMRNEAMYNRAHAYIETSQWGLAVPDLTPLAKDVRTAQGAEAKYLLARCYYQLGAKEMAEDEIMSFTQMNTQQQYWLAKALILLSTIQADKGDLFQAKQYLLTLVNNYRGNDDILSETELKLKEIEALESAQQAQSQKEEEEDEL